MVLKNLARSHLFSLVGHKPAVEAHQPWLK
jgi:hypothetical protein